MKLLDRNESKNVLVEIFSYKFQDFYILLKLKFFQWNEHEKNLYHIHLPTISIYNFHNISLIIKQKQVWDNPLKPQKMNPQVL